MHLAEEIRECLTREAQRVCALLEMDPGVFSRFTILSMMPRALVTVARPHPRPLHQLKEFLEPQGTCRAEDGKQQTSPLRSKRVGIGRPRPVQRAMYSMPTPGPTDLRRIRCSLLAFAGGVLTIATSF